MLSKDYLDGDKLIEIGTIPTKSMRYFNSIANLTRRDDIIRNMIENIKNCAENGIPFQFFMDLEEFKTYKGNAKQRNVRKNLEEMACAYEELAQNIGYTIIMKDISIEDGIAGLCINFYQDKKIQEIHDRVADIIQFPKKQRN